MSTGTENRRNGKAASCEPCRKAKIRCDHQKPTCGRCMRRGLGSRCYYHPAPLTKQREPPHRAVEANSIPQLTTPTQAQPARVPVYAAERNESYASTPQPVWPLATPEFHPRRPLSNKDGRDGARLDDEIFNEVKQALTHLKHMRLIHYLIEEYSLHAQAALIPRQIVLGLSSSLKTTVTEYSLDDPSQSDAGLTNLVHDVMRNTGNDAKITAEMDLADFLAIYSGAKLRLETIGLLFTLAGRSCLLGLAHDDDKREDFIRDTYESAYSCLRLSRTLAPDNNDVMLWQAVDYFRLTTLIEGESSPLVYRRLGDLSTYVFEFGIHRDSFNANNMPFFLTECRRKTFAAVYQSDKYVATLVDRPPRILRRFSDCKMPLDLTDEELFACSSESQAREYVTLEGWNRQAKYSPSTFQRMRFTLGTLREEILEFEYRPSNAENDAKLHALFHRCKETWESLPTHLQYGAACWDFDIPPAVCLMLTVMHLSLKSCDFLIHRLLEKSDAEAWEAMLKAASDSIETVLKLGYCLNRAVFLRHDFPYIVLGYGLPCAAVLTTTLQNISRSNGSLKFPPSLSRSTIIRNLSVFVSHLQSICSPGDGSHHICVQASKAISRTLDEVLDPPAIVPTETAAEGLGTPTSVNNSAEARQAITVPLIQTPLPGADSMSLPDIDMLGSDGLDGFDLSTWVKNIDWTGGAEWSTF